jgi:hypothetical protein
MKTALVIGDSHVDHSALAKYLKNELAAQGYTATFAGVQSAAATTWLNNQVVCRPKKDYCVDQNELPKNPDLLVISLGTNDVAGAASSGGDLAAKCDQIVQRIVRLADKYAPAKLVWVGPPWFKDTWQWAKNEYSAALYAAANRAGVAIFDSREPTKAAVQAGSGDGVHLGDKGSKVWAQAIVAELKGATPATTTLNAGVPLLVAFALVGAWLAFRRTGEG